MKKHLRSMTLLIFALHLALAPQQGLAASQPIDTATHKASSLQQDSFLGVPAVPHRVVINRQNTRAFGKSAVKIVHVPGGKAVVLPLPRHASAIQLHLPAKDSAILAWQEEQAMPYKPQGFLEKQRVTYESMAHSLGGSVTSLQGQYEALTRSIGALPPAEAEAALKKALPTLALIGTRLYATQQDLADANARAALLKDGIPLSTQLLIHLDTPLPVGEVISVEYSYTLANSHWKPVYIVDANTNNDTINFKLMAEITQNSDLDWNNTEVELSTAAGNEQSLPPVQPWVVRKSEATQARTYNMPMMAKAGVSNDETLSSSMGQFDADTTVAAWKLKQKISLPEGVTSLILQEENIQAKLQRITRPSSYGGGKVWLSASPSAQSTFLPEGEAQFLLDGIPVSKDIFAVKNNTMPFFFGVDPLVTVQIQKDIRKSAEDGIIHKEQVWQWGWTYTIENKRNQAVKVRVEEPETQLNDKAMSVTYADSPDGSLHTKGDTPILVWDVDIAPKGQAKITRSITVKAPKDMPVNPGR